MILVTGGTGLVGAHLLLDLVRSGNKVRATHRKNSNLQAVRQVFSYYVPSEEIDLYFNKIEWMLADVTDIPALTKAFSDVSRVYHSAALISFDPRDVKALRKINIEGTANIVNLCLSQRVEKLCYFSSIATMDPNIGEEFISENFSWNPEIDHNDYAISKHGAEIEVWRASQEGLPVIILNPGIIIGPGFWNTASGQLFKKVDKGFNFTFPKTTGFVGVQDVSKAAMTAMDSNIKNEQYIVVAENLSFNKVLKQVAKSLRKSPPKINLKPWMVVFTWIYQSITGFFGAEKNITWEDRKALFAHSFYSNKKIKKEFSFGFTPVKEVIAQTGRIYRQER